MKNLLLAVAIKVLLLIPRTSSGQAPTIQWAKCYGGSLYDKAYSTVQTSDGGYIMAGETTSNDSDVTGNHGNNSDCWIVKIDSVGNLQWQKCLGGSGVDIAQSIIESSNGGYILTGLTQSNDGDVTINYGSSDCWVIKLDNLGNIVWQKTYGSAGSDVGHCIVESSDHNFVIAGTFYDTLSALDYGVIKIDSTGAILWQNKYGGSSADEAWDIHETYDNGFIVAGWSSSNDNIVTGNNGYNDCWILKIDNEGLIEWEQNFGSSGDDYCYSILQSKDSGYIFISQPLWNDSDVSCWRWRDYWLVKLDNAGNMQWQQCYGGSGYETGYYVNQTDEGGYIVCGNSTSQDGDVTGNHGSDYWLIKTDSIGDLEWQKCLGGSSLDVARSVIETNDGGFIIGGSARSNDGDVTGNHGAFLTEDFWLVKLVPPVGASIQNRGQYSFSIYPNPATGMLHLSGLEQKTTITFFNLLGERIMQQKIKDKDLILDISKFSKGIYCIQVEMEKTCISKIFVKE